LIAKEDVKAFLTGKDNGSEATHVREARPTVAELQSLVNRYLPRRHVKISYRQLDSGQTGYGTHGIAYLKTRKIVIDSNPALWKFGTGCDVGIGTYTPFMPKDMPEVMGLKQLSDWVGTVEAAHPKLAVREHVIQVTLHEIGHFLFGYKNKMPK